MLDWIDHSTIATILRVGPEIFAWIAIIAGGVLILFLFEPKNGSSFPRYRRFRPYRSRYQFKRRSTPDLQDVARQLHAVMDASFRKERLLSASEYGVFKIIEADVLAEGR